MKTRSGGVAAYENGNNGSGVSAYGVASGGKHGENISLAAAASAAAKMAKWRISVAQHGGVAASKMPPAKHLRENAAAAIIGRVWRRGGERRKSCNSAIVQENMRLS